MQIGSDRENGLIGKLQCKQDMKGIRRKPSAHQPCMRCVVTSANNEPRHLLTQYADMMTWEVCARRFVKGKQKQNETHMTDATNRR